MSSAPIIKQASQPSIRTIIRKRIKELIMEHTDINERVFCSRPSDLWLTEIPCCLIYFTDDDAEEPDSRPRYYKRNLIINIHFLNRWEKQSELELVDDWFDSREFETIYAMEVDYSISGDFLNLDFIDNTFLLGSTPITLEGEGNKDVESSRIRYNVKYEECLNHLDPNNLDDFKTLYAQYLTVDAEPGDPDENKKVLAEDQIEL